MYNENKKLMKLLKRVVDPNGDTDIPALHDKIVALVRDDLLSVPKADRDGHLNPTWRVYLPLEVTRQDNSLTLTEEVGSFTNPKKQVIGRVGRTPTGYIFTISETKSVGTTLSLNCRKAIEWLFNERASFKKTRKKKLVKAKEAA